MRCATHPDVESNLRCARCDKPICPRCLVQTPVGAKCSACARTSKLPTYRVSPVHYVKAIGTALGMAIVCGIAWEAVRLFIPFFYLNLLVAPGIAYATSEVVSLAVNRKRGTGLVIIVSAAVIASYLLTYLLPWGFSFSLLRFILDLVSLGLGVTVVVNRMR